MSFIKRLLGQGSSARGTSSDDGFTSCMVIVLHDTHETDEALAELLGGHLDSTSDALLYLGHVGPCTLCIALAESEAGRSMAAQFEAGILKLKSSGRLPPSLGVGRSSGSVIARRTSGKFAYAPVGEAFNEAMRQAAQH